ncbi:dihydrofolate reductase family protein [Terriglobus sp. ADX1]|uniref:dihydrofolate reductase family protein n=1 Tax=Terriglobus sp. ADX1 TaxID=2794063 RepID=UPI002FE5D395
MGKVRIAGFSVSLDGFAAGIEQSLQDPLGKRGPELMQWFFPTKAFRAMQGMAIDGEDTADDIFARRAMEGNGAWILGRNMFGPVRGPWPDDSWKGWWGEEPPYHVPTFVLTHHARDPIVMKGGTTFYFVTDGVGSALEKAQQAAGEKHVRIGGGVLTARQYLQAGLVDSVHLAMAPVMLGRGENLLAGIDLPSLGFSVKEHVATNAATHVVLEK